jgi:hypothetical protein
MNPPQHLLFISHYSQMTEVLGLCISSYGFVLDDFSPNKNLHVGYM